VKAGKALNDIQGTLNVTVADSITAWGVAMNGPAALAPSDWGTWGRGLMSDTNHAMFDNGTNGDAVAGDSIWTFKKTYPVTETKGQVFKFGIGGGDNESGYGLNHLENIDDSNPTYTLSTQFGSINPNFYDAWDYTNRRPVVTVSVDDVNAIPAEFSLSQNYPNPFNPATSISFALPVESQVSLKIFNVLGQEVATVVDGVMKAGRHTVSFNASKLASGVYLYQMKTGSFTSLKKMLLTK
jgi:hypothetical protein